MAVPSFSPTFQPTVPPLAAPTTSPTTAPTTLTPALQPTARPTARPIETPTLAPTEQPTTNPSVRPTVAPSASTLAPAFQFESEGGDNSNGLNKWRWELLVTLIIISAIVIVFLVFLFFYRTVRPFTDEIAKDTSSAVIETAVGAASEAMVENVDEGVAESPALPPKNATASPRQEPWVIENPWYNRTVFVRRTLGTYV